MLGANAERALWHIAEALERAYPPPVTTSISEALAMLKQPSPDADPLPAADEAAGQPAAPTPLPGAAGDRPWHDDPQEIARLWRWLDEQCQLPPDVAEFIERADLWPEERERMVREQGRVTTDG